MDLMNKKYQVYYRIYNDKYFMFETDDLLQINLLVENYLCKFVLNTDCFYQEIDILIYEKDILVQSARWEFKYNSF